MKASSGIRQSRPSRGRRLSRLSTLLISSPSARGKPIDYGKYSRTKTLVCSLSPRSQECSGLAKKNQVPGPTIPRHAQANSLPFVDAAQGAKAATGTDTVGTE